MNPRGIWRRTTLNGFRAGDEAWEELLDLDALADAEDEDWFWNGVKTLPPLHNRAIVQLSHSGKAAGVLREWDSAAQHFVENGFTLGEALSDVEWLDNDTVLLLSAFGRDRHVTRSGNPRTVRLWRRGTAIEDAPVLFSVPVDHVEATATRDWSVAEERIVFGDQSTTVLLWRT